MFIGVARIALHIPGNNSLKGKRSVMRRVIERTRAKFNAAVAEVAENDLHRRGVIGIAVVGNDGRHVDRMLSGVIRFVEQTGVAPVTHIETEVIPMKGELGEAQGGLGEWNEKGADDEFEDVPQEEEEW